MTQVCPVCGAGELRVLCEYGNPRWRSDRRRHVSRAPRLTLLGCPACGLAHSAPLPSEEELAAYYSTPEGWERRVAPVGDEGGGAESGEDGLERKRALYAAVADRLEPHLASVPGGRGKAFDFGCGVGAWLDVLAVRGFETYGLEPGRAAAGIAGRRHRMLEEIPSEPSFELVIVNHVLEHVGDPLAVIEELAAATVPEGRIFISTPDLERLPEHRSFNYVASGIHIFSYTLPALDSLLGLGGFGLLADLRGGAEPSAARRLSAVARRADGSRSPGPGRLDAAIEAVERFRADGGQPTAPDPPLPRRAWLAVKAAIGRYDAATGAEGPSLS